jgi:hypothetical protein
MVKPTYQQNPSTNAVTLVFNIDEGLGPKGRGIVLKTRIGDVGPGTQVSGNNRIRTYPAAGMADCWLPRHFPDTDSAGVENPGRILFRN